MWETDIRSLAVQMQAALCHHPTLRSEESVRGGAAVSRNDVEWLSRPEFPVNGIEQIEQTRIDGFHLVCSVVTEDVVDFSQRIAQIRPLRPIEGLEGFPGMRIVE